MTITPDSARSCQATNFEPFGDQAEALELMLAPHVPLMRLSGNAGSGKTTLITHGLLQQFAGLRIAVAAFTHRACGVVRTKLVTPNVEVITSSSLLGFKPSRSADDTEK